MLILGRQIDDDESEKMLMPPRSVAIRERYWLCIDGSFNRGAGC